MLSVWEMCHLQLFLFASRLHSLNCSVARRLDLMLSCFTVFASLLSYFAIFALYSIWYTICLFIYFSFQFSRQASFQRYQSTFFITFATSKLNPGGDVCRFKFKSEENIFANVCVRRAHLYYRQSSRTIIKKESIITDLRWVAQGNNLKTSSRSPHIYTRASTKWTAWIHYICLVISVVLGLNFIHL